MNRHAQCDRIRRSGMIAIVRADSSDELVSVASALSQGGVDIIEITMTTPNALRVIEDVRRQCDDDLLVGVGSVLDAETARAAILAGAEFVVSPILNADIIELCHRYQKPAMPGAFTPTEAFAAHELGADFVKVFPANHLGPRYLKELLAPMPHIAPIPTGGIGADNAADYLAAGAVAIGIGSALVKKQWIAERRFDALTVAARELVEVVSQAKKESET